MDEELRRTSLASDDGLGRLEEELLIARLKAESHRCQAENDELRAELKASRAQHAEALRTVAAEWVRHRTYRVNRPSALPAPIASPHHYHTTTLLTPSLYLSVYKLPPPHQDISLQTALSLYPPFARRMLSVLAGSPQV